MTRALVLVWVGLLGTAHADDTGSSSRELADRSTTLFLGATWTPGPTVPIRIGAEAALRVQGSHVAFEARVGGGGAGSLNALGSVFGWHLGAGLGAALPVGDRLAITPMVGYDLFGMIDASGGSIMVHNITADIPIDLVLRRGVVLEVMAQVGIARYRGMLDVALVVGPRIGVVF